MPDFFTHAYDPFPVNDDVIGCYGDHCDAAPGVDEIPTLAVEEDGDVVERITPTLKTKRKVQEIHP